MAQLAGKTNDPKAPCNTFMDAYSVAHSALEHEHGTKEGRVNTRKMVPHRP